ncbi:MAG: ABC transporter ATP-binding protein [Thermomicrobiales bacterium]
MKPGNDEILRFAQNDGGSVAPIVDIRSVSKAFGRRPIIHNLSLTARADDLTVLYGPPSTGKTVLMRLLMGLEHPDSGEIWLRGSNVTQISAADRNIGYVPQSFALYPHISVHGNIAYPLKLAGVKDPAAHQAVLHAAAMLNITEHLGKRPDQLSGGQKQRVAIARGIVKQTEIFVLDDPLAGLDFKLREQLVDDLKQLQEAWKVTFIYSTSDAIEALTLADHVAVLDAGQIVESGPPAALYDSPVRVETMRWLGFPQTNFLTGTLKNRGGSLWCVTEVFEFPVRTAGAFADGVQVQVGIRPESVTLETGVNPNGRRIHASTRILLREDLGGEEIVYLDLRGTPLTTVIRHDAQDIPSDDQATISFDPKDLALFAVDGTRIGQGEHG